MMLDITPIRNILKQQLRAIAILTIVWILLTPIIALANSPPPPPKIWIDFKDWSLPINAVQVVNCNVALSDLEQNALGQDITDINRCEAPKLFAEYGECAIAGCILPKNSQSLESAIVPLACQDKTCLMAGEIFEQQPTLDQWFQLRVLSDDVLRHSQIFPMSGYLEQAWDVFQESHSLHVEASDAWDRDVIPNYFWGYGLLITLVIEIVILSLSLFCGKKERRIWIRAFVSFGLIHCVTYPLVWTLPYGLLPFQPPINRFMGLSILGLSFLYLGFLWLMRKAAFWKLILSSIFLFFVLYFTIFVAAFLVNYGQPLPLITGFKFKYTLGATEGVIVILEAFALRILSPKSLSIAWASLTSLLMNMMSVAIGILAWHL